MKKTALILALSMLLLLCGACGNMSETGNTVGMSISTLNNPFFVSLSDGAKNAAVEQGVSITVLDAGDDTTKQANDIEDLISKNVSVIIVNPVDSDAVAPAVKDAKERGIKIISVDREVSGVEVDCEISSDNVGGAEKAGKYLISLIGEGAKVAELEGVSGVSSTIDRGNGFHRAADGAVNIVSRQTANFNRADGLNVMENILQANADIKGVFAHNDEMALGAAEAIKAKGLDIAVVGFDATEDGQEAVKNGYMAATVAQNPKLMGETAVKAAADIINGKQPEKLIAVEVELITK